MYRNLRLLAVVPARGGSKGIPLKNIQPVFGIQLVTRVAMLIGSLDYIDAAVVSSDNDKIIESACEFGLEAPFRRPQHLSGDSISDYEVLIHALTETEKHKGVEYDLVMMLQPTSPLRRVHHLRGALDQFIDGCFDSVWSVSRTDSKYHPLKQLTLEEGMLEYYDSKGSTIIARQQLKPVYQRNGIVYVISRKCLLKYGNIKGERTGAYLVKEPSVSIDTMEDIEYVEYLMRRDGDPLELDSITGATQTSNAVEAFLNKELLQLKELLLSSSVR